MIEKGFCFALIGCLALSSAWGGTLEVASASDDAVEAYAIQRLEKAFKRNPSYPDVALRFSLDPTLPTESYRATVKRSGDALAVEIAGGDERGLLYGSMTLLEQLGMGDDAVRSGSEAARFPFRALKFNLPWMSYRAGEALRLHDETCRDLAFWEAFLDMMVDNRFNALTLWSLHPFHLMIRDVNYPEACDLSEEELAEWRCFWRALFAMAKERGIETYIVNWNVFVSPAFGKHHELAEYCVNPSPNYNGPGDKSELVKKYTRSTVTQVIDAYPNLTGLGVSLGERMRNFTPHEREQWIQETFVEGMKAAKRPIRFIHRLPFSKGGADSGAPGLTTEKLTRRGIESLDLPTTVLTEAKFNWSHAHSSPKLIKIHGGKMGDAYWDPPPTNYKIHWMARNEDFFALRWCEPDFVREHIELNGADYVGGYYLGSECYIPAKDYMTKPEFSTGYAFERQWLYYMTWGRLLYNPEQDDTIFEQACQKRYGADGAALFQALRLGSRMPLRLASFYDFTWDFTLYSEGFMANTAKSNPERFITVDDLIQRGTLDPRYLSVKEYVGLLEAGASIPKDRVTPSRLAEESIRDGMKALEILQPFAARELPDAFKVEEADARAWAHLSIYFGEKTHAAVAMLRFRNEGAVEQGKLAVHHLENASRQWELLAEITDQVYVEMPLAHVHGFNGEGDDERVFHWKRLSPSVEAELQRAKKEVAQEQHP